MIAAVVIVGIVPAVILLVLALIARGAARRMPASPGPQFAPLAGATVVDDALMLDADERAIAATLIDLAVRRRIRLLTADAQPAGSRRTRTPLGVEVIEGAALTVDEVRLLEALFGQGSTSGTTVRRFSADRRRLRRNLLGLLDPARERLQAAGMFRAGRRHWPVALLRTALGLTLLFDVILIIGALAEHEPAGAAVVAVGAALSITALLLTPKPWRTFLPPAEPIRAHLAGLREYMALAEADQIRVLQSTGGALLSSDVSDAAKAEQLQRFHLHEKLLPYAVLFGMEKTWAEALRHEAEQLPLVEGLGDVLEAIDGVFEVIEFVGDVAQLAGAVVRIAGGAAALFDGLDL